MLQIIAFILKKNHKLKVFKFLTLKIGSKTQNRGVKSQKSKKNHFQKQAKVFLPKNSKNKNNFIEMI